MMMVTLIEHEKSQVREREGRGEQWIDTGFIFTTSKGTPTDPRNFYREFRRIFNEAGLGHWRPTK